MAENEAGYQPQTGKKNYKKSNVLVEVLLSLPASYSFLQLGLGKRGG
jgi:hypothetical protein